MHIYTKLVLHFYLTSAIVFNIIRETDLLLPVGTEGYLDIDKDMEETNYEEISSSNDGYDYGPVHAGRLRQ